MTSTSIDIDKLYLALCKTCAVLDELSCDYFLAGGTLLGAARQGDLIAHDVDFDLDCLIKDEDKILDAAARFAAEGLTVKRKLSLSPRRFDTQKTTDQALNSSCIQIEYEGAHVGDICIFTVFDDGIARRFDIKEGIYFNPKMSLPDWYYGGDEYLTIRGRRFRSVRAPELVLEKIYGADWRTPLKPGQFKEGRNKTSGSVPDADIEKLILHAIEQGWKPHRADAPPWPQPVRWVSPPTTGRNWILRHEPMTRPDLAADLHSDALLNTLAAADDTQRVALLQIVAAKALQAENARLGAEVERLKQELAMLRKKIKSLPIPTGLRHLLKTLHTKILTRS